MVQILVRVISVCAITIILGALLTSILKSNERESVQCQSNEHIVVHLPKMYIWVGASDVLLIAGLLLWMMISPYMTEPIWVGIVFAIFLLLGLVLAVEPFIWKIHVFRNEDYFLYTTGFGRTYKVRYADIVSYKDSENTLMLRTERKRFFIDNKATNFRYLHTMILQKGVKKYRKP